jgi:transaldolase
MAMSVGRWLRTEATCETVLDDFAKAGIDVAALGAKLQDEGAAAFVKSWNELMDRIVSKSGAISKAG